MAADGYVWWYLDALSDDGEHALTLIAFVGSVFSPYYAWARRRGRTDPQAHCAVNVALYPRRGRGRWAMTERGARSVECTPTLLRIGPSLLQWRADGTLAIDIDERCAPLPQRIAGRIVVRPGALGQQRHLLDAAGRHRWTPIAPLARVEVDLAAPQQRWQGRAYLDSNSGDEPLEAAFATWSWQRALHPDGSAVVHYDVQRRDGSAWSTALQIDADGSERRIAPAPAQALPRTRWGVARPARGAVALTRTLEDGPFYSRSLLATADGGWAVHESLSLDRFQQRWVQALLPFRMPRRARGPA